MPEKEKSVAPWRTQLFANSARSSRWLLRLRGSNRAIAGGFAVGTVVAFTPTIGFQTLVAIGLATVLNVNRPAAIPPTWITNPITIPPVYAFTYYLGTFFWPGPAKDTVAVTMRDAARELVALDFLSLGAQLDVFLGLGVDVFMPMWIGGLIVGGLAAAVVYPVALRTATVLRRRRVTWRTRRNKNLRKRRSRAGHRRRRRKSD